MNRKFILFPNHLSVCIFPFFLFWFFLLFWINFSSTNKFLNPGKSLNMMLCCHMHMIWWEGKGGEDDERWQNGTIYKAINLYWFSTFTYPSCLFHTLHHWPLFYCPFFVERNFSEKIYFASFLKHKTLQTHCEI